MKKFILSRVTILCVVFVFMFSNIIALAAPVSTANKVALGTNPKGAPTLQVDKTYEVDVKEGQELWFKVNVAPIKGVKTHISIERKDVYGYMSIFNNLQKAERYDAPRDYIMKDMTINYPLSWDTSEHYVNLYAVESGTLKLIIKSETKAPEIPTQQSNPLCPSEVLSKVDGDILKNLSEFRNVRDKLLSSSDLGKSITNVYYNVSKQIYLPLITDKTLRNDLLNEAKNLDGFINALININNDKKTDYIIKDKDIEALKKIKDKASEKSDDKTKKEIDKVWNELELEKYSNKPLSKLVEDKLKHGNESLKSTEIIVNTSSNVDLTKIKDIVNSQLSKFKMAEKIDVKQVESLFDKLEKTFLVSIPSGKYIDILEKLLNKHSAVKFAEQNYIFKASDNDLGYNYQWNLENTTQKIPTIQGNTELELMFGKQIDIQGKKGADINYKSLANLTKSLKLNNVPIAVIDTGINYELADFKGKVDLNKGYNFVKNTKNVMDDNGHGTHVSGIIAAQANNGYSIAGINQYSTIIPIKALDANGAGDMYNIVKGIKHAVDNGAKVINMSLGDDPRITAMLDKLGIETLESSVFEEALKYAEDKNVTVVCASGNSFTNQISYPASSKYTISVGSISNSDVRSTFSNYGEGLDLVAPGESVPSLYNNGEVIYASGTSMASPHVAAVAGLLYSVDSTMTPSKAKDILHRTSRDLGEKGYDQVYGYGCLDVVKAVSTAAGK